MQTNYRTLKFAMILIYLFCALVATASAPPPHCQPCLCSRLSYGSQVNCNILITGTSVTFLPTANRKILKLDYTGQKISQIEKNHFIAQLTELHILRLIRCNLNKIDSNTFTNLKKLRTLFLSENKLKRLEKDIFKYNEKIVLLYIESNLIEELDPEIFNNLIDLEEIDLADNKIRHIPNNLFNNNRNLRKIHLSKNPLTTINDLIFRQQKFLTNLALGDCKITFFHKDALKNNVNLQNIFLYNNLIEKLDKDTFLYNKNLNKISLSRNRIKSLPAKLFNNLRQLNYLFLDSNELTEIPEKIFINNNDIIRLALNNNKLTSLDGAMFKTNDVNSRVISLQDNQWICDCSTKYLFKYNFNQTPICSSPDILKGTYWDKLSFDKLCQKKVEVDILNFTKTGDNITLHCRSNIYDIHWKYFLHKREVVLPLKNKENKYLITQNINEDKMYEWANLTIYNFNKEDKGYYR